MGLLDIFKKKFGGSGSSKGPRYLYTEDEIAELDKYIEDSFGSYENVFHEIVSPDIHLDVCIVSPSDDKPYYKLVTMGAGAYAMNIPKQWEKYDIAHAEYIIYLPKGWNIQSNDEKDYWPMRVLKSTARLPIQCDTWLSYGHTAQDDEEGSAYASNTRFNSVILDCAENEQGDIRLRTSSGKTINFYEVVPLYPEELEFKMNTDAATLFEKFKEKGIQCKVVDINRRSAIQ